MTQSFAFIALGILVYLSSGWLGRFYSHRADKWERDGVIRHGGFGQKLWQEDHPEEFVSRIDGDRFFALALRWFLKILGVVFAIAGLIQLIGLLLR